MLKRLMRNRLLKNILTLMSGSVLAQLLTFIIAPIISRIYGPEDFGVFSIYSSILLILMSMSSLRYETTIVIVKDEIEGIKMLYISIIICIISSSIMFFLLLIFFDDFISIINIDVQHAFIFYLLPLSVFAQGLNRALIHWKNKLEQYNKIARLSITRSLLVNSSQVILGLSGLLKTGLIIGQIMGIVFNSIRLFKSTLKDISRYNYQAHVSDFKEQIIKFKHFPLYGAPQVFLNSFTRNTPPIILAIFFNPSIVGLYALSYKMLQVPISLISEALRKVLLKEISVLNNNNKPLSMFVLKLSLLLIVGSSILLIPLALNGERVFVLIFGDNWVGAGTFASLLIFWLIFRLANVPSIVALQVIGKQRFLLIFEVFFTFFSLGSLLVTGQSGNPNLTILIYSIISALFYLLLIVLTVWILKRNGMTNHATK